MFFEKLHHMSSKGSNECKNHTCMCFTNIYNYNIVLFLGTYLSWVIAMLFFSAAHEWIIHIMSHAIGLFERCRNCISSTNYTPYKCSLIILINYIFSFTDVLFVLDSNSVEAELVIWWFLKMSNLALFEHFWTL